MMETAKVDVRKLQMLNDRINQTIDALNQVRLSVHGMNGNGTAAMNGGQHLGLNGFPGAFAGGIPFGSPLGFGGGLGGGLPVQAALANPVLFAQLQQLQQQQIQGQPWGGVQQPWGAQHPWGGQHPWGVQQQPWGAQHSWGGQPWGQGVGVEAIEYLRRGLGGDPFAVGRIAQTFPFAQWGYSPLTAGFSPYAPGVY